MDKRLLSRFRLLLLVVFAAARFSGVAQTISNEGTDFYAVFPTHIPASGQAVPNGPVIYYPANYSVFITGKENSSGVVSVGNFLQAFTVTANTVTTVNIPRDQAYIDDTETRRALSNRAIHIKVDDGQPKVVVYGHIYAGRRSAASLILPKEAMGQHYYTMNYTNVGNGGGDNFIVVAATEPNTRIFLRRNGVDLIPNGFVLSQPGDVYEYLAATDLTGTEVVTDTVADPCKRFAVFSGSTNVIIESGSCSLLEMSSSDPLYQQNYPVENWGSGYGFIPFSSGNERLNGSIYRVLAKDDGTEVRFNGTLVATLNKGRFYSSPVSNVPGLITSSKPVAVAQYALTQRCAGGGPSDPDMVILNPVEYSIKDITLFSSKKELIEEQFINVLIPSSATSSFRVNGARTATPFTSLGSTGYSYLKLNATSLPASGIRLSANEGFNAIAYGFGSYESYSYSAGTTLASLQNLSAVDPLTLSDVQSACTNQDFKFKLTLQDKATQLTWKFGDDAPVIENSPQPDSTMKDGKKIYIYYYPKPAVFDTPGTRDVKVFVVHPASNPCFGVGPGNRYQVRGVGSAKTEVRCAAIIMPVHTGTVYRSKYGQRVGDHVVDVEFRRRPNVCRAKPTAYVYYGRHVYRHAVRTKRHGVYGAGLHQNDHYRRGAGGVVHNFYRQLWE